MRESSVKSMWYGAVAALLSAIAGCGDAAGPGGAECRGAQDLESCLPSWQEFSPLLAEQAPAAEGAPAVSEVNETLERYDTLGNTISLGNTTFVCSEQTYNFLDNPDRAISFNLDETVIWPGALIQGQSHRDGANVGGLLELPIRERSPLSVSVTFNNQDNTRLVENPEFGAVKSALGAMIGNAEGQGLATSNNIEFDAKSYSSEKQAALAFGLSGRYLAFEASASGSVSRSVTTNVVVAKFIQQMYVAGVTQPATPADFFSEAFTADRFQTHAGLGRLGPANPPLYVSRIGYGRMMVFAMSAKAEASEIQGTLRASWQGIGAGGSGSLDAKQQSILQESEIRITQVGGDQGNALAAIRSGNLADYFTNTAPLTSAAPLWFELKSLTGQVAQVSEPGTYTETVCTPKLPGTFDYQAEQSLAIPFTAGTQRQTVQADVNADGRMDLVFNERRTSPALNRVHVALAGGAGVFTLQAPVESSDAPAEGWENFVLLAADLDGDGRDDLVWNALTATNNILYSALVTGAGTFAWRPRQERVANGWSGYNVTAGDLNGDGKVDLLWNNAGANSTLLRTYFGLVQADTTFVMSNFWDRAGNYSGYAPPVTGQFDGANGADLALNALGTTYNNTYVGLFTPTSASSGTLAFPTPLSYSIGGWTNYRLRVGDIDGVNATDLVWVNTQNGAIHRAMNNGNGTFAIKAAQIGDITTGTIDPFVADFNNDGRADVLMNRRTDMVNELAVGFGVASGDFTFPAGIQTHPTTPSVGWVPFDQVFVGDVNGDGKADIVWTNPSSDARVFVALSK
jgi:hypothetical protein